MNPRKKTESSTYNTMRKIIFFVNVFAGAPYSITKNGKLAIHFIKKWFEITILTAALFMEIYSQIQRTTSEEGNIFIFAANAREAVKLVYILFSIVDLNRKHDSLKKVFDITKELDELMPLTDKNVKKLKWKIKMWIAILGFASVLLVILRHMRRKKNFKDSIINLLFIFLNIRMLLQRVLGEVLFTSLGVVVSCYLDAFVDRLVDLRKSSELRQTTVFIQKVDRNEREKYNCVDELREIYRLIQNLKTQTNDVFSLRLLVLIIHAFSEILFFTFANIVFFQYSGHSQFPTELLAYFSDHWIVQLLLMNSWLLLIIIKFFLIIDTCHSVAAKGRNVSIAIHEFRSYVSYAQPLKNELLAFSQEVTVRDPYITAGNLFTMDYSLISSLLGATVMHIIILLQFQQATTDHASNPIRDMLMRS